MTYCVICCNDISNKGPKLLDCQQCRFSACHDCHKQYILSNIIEPQCMECKNPLSREYLMEIFDREFVKKKFLPHMALLLLEQEKMLLPQTQPEANKVLKLRSLSAKLKTLPTNQKLLSYCKLNNIEHDFDERKRLRNLEKIEIWHAMRVVQNDAIKEKDIQEEDVQATYIMKCPCEDCRGFVTSEYFCETCNSIICDRCRCPKSDKHICSKEDVQNAREIINSTKPCPKCFVPIFKNGGCSQIWCPQCHVTFDFNTGVIDKGPIHNAHYFEWLAANPIANEVETVACGEVPTDTQLTRVLLQYRIPLMLVLEIYRYKVHIEQVILRECSIDRVKDNIDLRIKYLVSEIDEEKWLSTLLYRQNRRMKLTSIHGLFTLILTITNDILRKVYVYPLETGKYVDEYNNLIIFQNESMKRICKIHGGGVPKCIENI